jgi:hypothetical protein
MTRRSNGFQCGHNFSEVLLMRLLRPLLTLIVLTAVLAVSLRAQEGEDRESDQTDSARPLAKPFLRVFTPDELGVSSINYHVTVLPNGLVYVANGYGLLEYDGETWRRIPQTTVSQTTVLVGDAGGRLWTSVRGGLSQLLPDATGALQFVDRAERLPAEHRNFGSPKSSLAAPEGVYLLSTSHLLLMRPDGTVGVWRPATEFDALFSLEGAAHVVQQGRGLFRVESDKLTPVSTGAMKNLPVIFAARAETPGATRQLLLTRVGPYTWDGPGTEPKPQNPGIAALFREPTAPFRTYGATAAIFLADGRMVFGGNGGLGLLVLTADGQRQFHLKKNDGMPTAWINDLAADAQGGVWLAHPIGVTRVQLDSPFQFYGGPAGFNGIVRDVVRHNDRLYVAHGEGVWVANPALSGFRLLGDLPANTAGANRFLPLGPRLFVTATGPREVLPNDRLRSIAPQLIYQLHASRTEPGMFLGVERSTVHRRLWLYAARGTTTRAVGPVPSVVEPDRFGFDSGDGYFWGSTMEGRAWRADFRAGLRPEAPAEYFDLGLGETDFAEMSAAVVFPFAGGVSAGGGGKLLRFDPAAKRFVPETRIRDLPSLAGFMPPVAGRDGSQWFFYQGSPHAPQTRIFRVTPDGADQWRATEFATAAVRRVLVNNLYDEPDRRTLWLATSLGLISANTAWQPMRPRPPLTVLIRQVETSGGRVLFAGDASLATAPATLRPEETALHFSFAAPTHEADYLGHTHTLYRSRLEGFEEQWTEWSPATTREFTNLPSRHFALQVQARDPDRRESAPVSFAFFLPPPWWRTPWALSGYGVAIAFALLGLERLRTRTLRRKNEKLEAVVAERTADLRRQNDELARLHRLELDEKISARLGEEKARLDVLRYQLNPHFLFNSLTSIRSQISSANASAREAVERLTDFCRLTLHGRKPDERASVGEEMAMLRAYLDIEQARMRELLRVEFAVEPGLDEAPLPRLLLLPLVENALKYGQATSAPPLQVRIAARAEGPDLLCFEIANTGHWVRHAAAHDLPSMGIGHDNLRERLARHYPGMHEFTHEEAGGWVLVRVRLPRAQLPVDADPERPVL